MVLFEYRLKDAAFVHWKEEFNAAGEVPMTVTLAISAVIQEIKGITWVKPWRESEVLSEERVAHKEGVQRGVSDDRGKDDDGDALGGVVLGVGKGSAAALRQVGKVLESVDNVLANPSLLKGRSYVQVRGILNDSKGWVNSIMTKTRGMDKGWVFRQVNSKGQPTGRIIQYHPGSRRHFGGNPYWKVSDGANTFRFPAN